MTEILAAHYDLESPMPNPGRPLVKAATFLALSSAAYTYWFKSRQLALVSAGLGTLYPASFWLESFFSNFLIFGNLYLLLLVISRRALRLRNTHRHTSLTALPFLVLGLPLTGLSFPVCAMIFLLLQLGLMAAQTEGLAWPGGRAAWAEHALALLVILAGQVVFNQFLSPLGWANPMIAFPEHSQGGFIPVLVSLFKAHFVNAKLFSFFGLDHNYWGAILRPTVGIQSLLVPAIAFVLDLPALDTEGFQRLILVLSFLACSFGSFGFYLFLRYAQKLAFMVALLGGLLFIFVNPYFIASLTMEYANFYYFLFVPWALLLSHRAFVTGRPSTAGLAGLAMAAPIAFLNPHPEQVIHGVTFCTAYIAFLAVFGKGKKKAWTALWIIASFAALSAHLLWPVISAAARGEAIYFGHQTGVFPGHVSVVDFLLGPQLQSFGIWFAITVACGPALYRERSKRREIVFFGAVLAFFALFIAPQRNEGFFAAFLARCFPHVNFFSYWRVWHYGALSGFVISLHGLDLLARGKAGGKAALFGALCGLEGVLLYLPVQSGAVIDAYAAHLTLYEESWANLLEAGHARAFLALVALTVAVAGACYLYGRGRRAAALVAPACAFALIPYLGATHLLASGKTAGNPGACRPYIALQTILTNYRGLTADPASLPFIRKKLREFEVETAAPDRARLAETETYLKALTARSARSAASLSDADVLAVAKETYRAIDRYYLEEAGCFYDYVFERKDQHIQEVRVPNYNNSALLYSLPDANQLIRFGTGDSSPTANGQGLRMVNSSESINTRFMASYLPVHVLYVMPGSSFRHLGDFDAPFQVWYPLKELLRPENRALGALSGVDVYVGFAKDIQALPEAWKEGLAPVASSAPGRLDRGLAMIRDTRSNGLAYTPHTIRYIAEDPQRFAPMQAYFRTREASDFSAMTSELGRLRASLLELHSPGEALVEDNAKAGTVARFPPGTSSLTLEGLIDNRAALRVRCGSSPCVAILNFADIDGWRAFVDAKEAPIRAANYGFMAVEAPAGDHLVWFENRSVPVYWGFSLTMLASLLVLGLVSRAQRKDAYQKVR